MSVIDDYLKNFPSSKRTRYNYGSFLRQYFKQLKIEPDNYFTSNRNYEQDMKSFWESIQHQAPKTIKSKVACIRGFLEDNDVELKPRVWKGFNRRGKGSQAITRDKAPTNTILKQILTHGTAKEKAIFLMMSSSGMREGEAVKKRETIHRMAEANKAFAHFAR